MTWTGRLSVCTGPTPVGRSGAPVCPRSCPSWCPRPSQVPPPLLLAVEVEAALKTLSLVAVCVVKVDQKTGGLYWVSCTRDAIGATTADGRHSRRLYRTTREVRDLSVDWLRGALLWLEDRRVFAMGVAGGRAEALQRLAGGVAGNLTFDLMANSLLWSSDAGRAAFPALPVAKASS